MSLKVDRSDYLHKFGFKWCSNQHNYITKGNLKWNKYKDQGFHLSISSGLTFRSKLDFNAQHQFNPEFYLAQIGTCKAENWIRMFGKNFVLFAGILVFGIAVACVASKPSWSNVEKPLLRFNNEGKLKIANFADLHYGEFPGTPRGRAQDGNSTRVMTDILNFENPDFVVFTGDLITGDVLVVNPTSYIDLLFTPLVELNYKWASTYGNHDNGVAVTREAIFRTESKYELSYTQHGGDGLSGLTNYYLPVYPAESESDQSPALILWFFDSRGGFDFAGIKPSNVDESVVEWFVETNANITKLWGKLPALAFFHIPTLDYEDVQGDMENYACVGLVDEAVVPQDRDTKFMEALVNSGTVMTTFVGHDHGNGWCCHYKTLEICYNRHTGYGGYGAWTRGARIVELNYANIIGDRRNYIRLENGTIIDQFSR